MQILPKTKGHRYLPRKKGKGPHQGINRTTTRGRLSYQRKALCLSHPVGDVAITRGLTHRRFEKGFIHIRTGSTVYYLIHYCLFLPLTLITIISNVPFHPISTVPNYEGVNDIQPVGINANPSFDFHTSYVSYRDRNTQAIAHSIITFLNPSLCRIILHIASIRAKVVDKHLDEEF